MWLKRNSKILKKGKQKKNKDCHMQMKMQCKDIIMGHVSKYP